MSVRVLITDDSATVRGVWKKIFSEQPDFIVCGLAENGQRAIDMVNEVEADLVLLDIEMPVMDGLTALPLLLRARQGVRVIMASSLTHHGSNATVQALASGASDYIGKPSSTSLGTSIDVISKNLLEKARMLKYPRKEKNIKNSSVFVTKGDKNQIDFGSQIKSSIQAILIGCSTSGPNALVTVLKHIDFSNFHVPILIVQHMPAFFINMLADRVSDEIGRKCHVVSDEMLVDQNFVGIAPGEYHLELKKSENKILTSLNKNPPENFCRPSVDPLFRSAADVYSGNVLAVVLTGMGEDGRLGSIAVKKAGGHVIVQDEESSVVWGMPGAVVKEGVADAILSIEEIAPYIQNSVFRMGRSA